MSVVVAPAACLHGEECAVAGWQAGPGPASSRQANKSGHRAAFGTEAEWRVPDSRARSRGSQLTDDACCWRKSSLLPSLDPAFLSSLWTSFWSCVTLLQEVVVICRSAAYLERGGWW